MASPTMQQEPSAVVRLRGLPYSASEADVVAFFDGWAPIDVVLLSRAGGFCRPAVCQRPCVQASSARDAAHAYMICDCLLELAGHDAARSSLTASGEVRPSSVGASRFCVASRTSEWGGACALRDSGAGRGCTGSEALRTPGRPLHRVRLLHVQNALAVIGQTDWQRARCPAPLTR